MRAWLVARQVRHVARHRDAVPRGVPRLGRSGGAPARGRLHARQGAPRALADGRSAPPSCSAGRCSAASTRSTSPCAQAVAPRAGALAYEVALVVAFVGHRRGARAAVRVVLDLSPRAALRLQPHDLAALARRHREGDRARRRRSACRCSPRVLWIMARRRRRLVALGLGARGWRSCVAAQVVVPSFIAPLFNRFEELKDAPLRARVQALMARAGFAARGLFVMDGSRRSAHANAYFTGFGSAKRVVFFDTLLSRARRRRGRGGARARARPLQAAPHPQAHARDGRAHAGLLRPARLAGDAQLVLHRPGRRAQPDAAERRARADPAAARRAGVRRVRVAASSPAGRAATSSRPTPSRRRMPTAPSSPRRCSSCTRTTPPR